MFDPFKDFSAADKARSAAKKAAHEAAAYDKWFRGQVQEAIDDPRPSIPYEEVAAEFAGRRAALRKRIAGKVA